MPRPFDRAVLVFNPHSTGDGPGRTEALRAALAERAPELPVVVRATEYAGHAREIAREEACAPGCPLVVSVSGDGGYSEVVDGIMAAGRDRAIAAVHAAGNANDHRRVTGRRPLADAIVAGDVRRVDLLRLTLGEAPAMLTIYAHSYIGLGITPTVALELEEGGKGSLREVWSTVRTFARFRPFEIETDDGHERFDSIILANISEMAKYAVLSDAGRPDDGRFEVIVIRHTAKWRVLLTALRAALWGLGPQPTASEYRFTTIKPIPMQVDGEVMELDEGTRVAVEIVPGALAVVS